MLPELARDDVRCLVVDLGSLATREEQALASAAVDDVLAWSLLAVVVVVGTAGGADSWHILLAVPYVLLMFFGVRPLLRMVLARHGGAGRLTPSVLGLVLIGLLLSSYATEWLGVHFIFGAFVFGAVLPRGAGEALRRAGQRRRAGEKLDQAREIFLELGAVRWVERCDNELRRARPRPRRDRELTPAESRVAGLVAQGKKNSEVAAQLFTTVSTVEAHLTRIYRKLGIRSRTELARLVADGSLALEHD